MKRQNVRKLLLIIAFLLFPITIFYLSPYLIIRGALEGIITGSFVVFLAMLLGSVFLGRLFCGYLCPVGGLQECAVAIKNDTPKLGWKNNIKYVIWIVWIIGVILSFVFRKQEITVNAFYMTDHGISISNIYAYIIYYGIILLIFLPSVIAGKRAFCHYFCWMAPFMVIGSKLGSLLHIPRLRLAVDKNACVSCHICDRNCPMSLEVTDHVQKEKMEDSECILCGACVDHCPKKAIKYKFK